MRHLIIVLLSFLLTITIIAQDECSSFVRDALITVDTLCETTGRNELCYGNNIVSVTTLDGEELAFSQPGDIVSITDIDSIRTSPFAEPDAWGIALMRLQANIPDSLPGQNVTFLLFGDSNLTNAVPADETMPSLSASTTNTINVRSGPSTNNSVIDSLQASTMIDLIGRNAAGDWVYFTAEDSSGWLFASLLQIDGDVMTLDEVPNDFAGSSAPKPMQAVYFSSGIGQSSCNDVPQDGILIQTPDYKEPIELIVNDVQIELGSTVYVSAQAGGLMTVYVLEGQIDVTALDVTLTVPHGAFVTIPMDDNLNASDTPNSSEPYEIGDLEALPISALEEEITISRPTTSSQIDVLNTCSGTIAGTVNVRSGPGESYPVTFALSQDGEVRITAQAIGMDGFIWYSLYSFSEVSDLWIRSDLVTLGDYCDDIPVTDKIPEVPTPALPIANNNASSSGGSGANLPSFTVVIGQCNDLNTLSTGQIITFNTGMGRWETPEEAATALASHSGTIIIDGTALPVTYTGITLHTGGGVAPGYGDAVEAIWAVTSGEHTVIGSWTTGQTFSCTFTVP